MLRLLMIGAVAAAGLSTPALAADPASGRAAKDPNEVVCEKQEVVGSRLATKRVCRTRAQWAELRAQDRQDLEKTQVQRGAKAE